MILLKRFSACIFGLIMVMLISTTAYAEPKIMSDGGVFDSEFYAELYPDVVAECGTDADSLYRHYKEFGIKEGRKAYRKYETNDVAKDVKAKTILVIGDSRTCSLIDTLRANPNYTLVFTKLEGETRECILKTEDTYIVICAEGGGGYINGALERSVQNMNDIIVSHEEIRDAESYYYFNLYGVNDVRYDYDKNLSIPDKYINRDTAILSANPKIEKMYQFNAGPIDPEGWLCKVAVLSNEIIREYNKNFKSTEKVTVVDLYSYLIKNGFGAADDADGDSLKSGIHYDVQTDNKIIELILSLV